MAAPAAPSHCKLCELEDFRDPELQDLIRDIFESDREHFGEADFPAGREYRKYWEVAMTARAFRAAGKLRGDARILGVGAGHEATIYWLTRHVRQVVATDLYSADDAWSETDSSAAMLTNPGRFWDAEWNPERLEVLDMNALELRFPDDHFDGVFSSSSIEHFGGLVEIRRSVEEIYRVLKPGGVAALATEFKVRGDGNGWPGLFIFDEGALRRVAFDGIWWDPMTPLDTSVSEGTLAAPVDLQEALADQATGRRGWSQYPHLVLEEGEYLWTSVHVAMLKSAAASVEWRRRSTELEAPPEGPMLREKLADLRARVARRLGRGS